MQINIISDGLFGKRAFENIGRQFPCRWVTVPYSGSPIMEDVEIEPATLLISVFPMPGTRMSSWLLSNREYRWYSVSPPVPDLSARRRRSTPSSPRPRPCAHLNQRPGAKRSTCMQRSSDFPVSERRWKTERSPGLRLYGKPPCGSTRGAAAECVGMQLYTETLRHFGLRICHHCVAPRFGKTCDKEVSGALHVRQLLHSIPKEAWLLRDLKNSVMKWTRYWKSSGKNRQERCEGSCSKCPLMRPIHPKRGVT